jgi:hypothetical protein
VRHHGGCDQGQHRDAAAALKAIFANRFQKPDRTMSRPCAVPGIARRPAMKSPVVLVAVTLAAAILLAASLLIATGTRGEDAVWPTAPAQVPASPAIH